MEDFYRRILHERSGHSWAEALRAAQLAMKGIEDYQDPFVNRSRTSVVKKNILFPDVTVLGQFWVTLRNSRFRQPTENKPFAFPAVSGNFPGMDYVSAALTIKLRDRLFKFNNLRSFSGSPSFRRG
jgi:hypothetical protein